MENIENAKLVNNRKYKKCKAHRSIMENIKKCKANKSIIENIKNILYGCNIFGIRLFRSVTINFF